MNGIDRFKQIDDAKRRWLELGMPQDLSADPVVVRDARAEQRPEIIELAKVLGVQRLTFFSLPDNGRRPDGHRA